MTPKTDTVRHRTRWLVPTGFAVAVALVLLAATADRALRDRHALALEGRVLTLAHVTESDLRDAGFENAQQGLEAALRRWEKQGVVGLALLGDRGLTNVAGSDAPEASVPPGASRTLLLYLGRAWKDAAPEFGVGGHGGQRFLRITLEPRALVPPVKERLLLPATTFAGLALVALAMFGGRQLVRYELAQRDAAERRRIEALARAGAGLAHQLRTPLATVKGSAQLLLERNGKDGHRLDTMLEQIERMEAMLSQLLDFARPPVPEPSQVALAPLIAEIAALAPPAAVNVPADLAVWADARHVCAILGNLLENARHASPAEGTIEISAGEQSDRVTIAITDRGPGPGENPEALFEPYTTGRADGTGLGLPIARSLAEANGGTLRLLTRRGGGAQAVLELPRKAAT